MMIEVAGAADIPALVALVNRAYRGAAAATAWAHEADLLAGQRTDAAELAALVGQSPGAVLVLRDDARPVGCVAILPTAEAGVWSLGMLSVDPALQTGGHGRRLIEAAESRAAAYGADRVTMTVIGLRTALIAWYERRGYSLTGARKPFPYGDERFGIPLRDDLDFVVLDKRIGAALS